MFEIFSSTSGQMANVSDLRNLRQMVNLLVLESLTGVRTIISSTSILNFIQFTSKNGRNYLL